MIARELCRGDRVKIASTTFVVGADPTWHDEDRIDLVLVNPTTKLGGLLTCSWNKDFDYVSPHPSIYDGEAEGDIIPET